MQFGVNKFWKKFFKDYKLQIISTNYTRNHVITCTKKVISEKLVRKIGASKCSYCDQTCHIEKENKFHMVCDMMFICPFIYICIIIYQSSDINSLLWYIIIYLNTKQLSVGGKGRYFLRRFAAREISSTSHLYFGKYLWVLYYEQFLLLARLKRNQ